MTTHTLAPEAFEVVRDQRPAPKTTCSPRTSGARIPRLSDALFRDDDGIWRTSHHTEISHPEVCQDWYREVEDRSYWYKHRAERIIRLMQRFPPNGAVFDIGGGNGNVSLAMKRAGLAPVLIEPSPSAARNAQSRGLRDIICSTLQDAEFHGNALPAAGMFDVLEHIQDDVGLLGELNAALRPAGRLYLTVPSYRWLWSEHDVRVGHFRRYTLGRLCRLLRETGYDVEFASYMFATLTAPVLLMRSLPYRMFGGGRGNQETFAKEHACDGGLLSRGINALLSAESCWSRGGWKIPFGTSCVVVARKTLPSATSSLRATA